jgi:hypothetical protein
VPVTLTKSKEQPCSSALSKRETEPPRPFQILAPHDVLADLRARLGRTRFTAASDSAYWAAGTDPGYLRNLFGYWADGFDWRAAEARLNAYPQDTAEWPAVGCILCAGSGALADRYA